MTDLRSQKAQAASQQRILADIRAAGFDYSQFDSSGSLPLFPKTQDELLRRVIALSFNPLAHRILQIPCDLLHQQSSPFQTENTEEEEILRNFWEDPINNFPEFSRQIIYDYGLFGEQCFTVFTNPISKRVRLGRIHPFTIEQTILDPDNDRIVIGVKLRNEYNPRNHAISQDDQILIVMQTPNSTIMKKDDHGIPYIALDEQNEIELFSPQTCTMRQRFCITDPVSKERKHRFCFLFQENPHFDLYSSQDWGLSLRGTPDLTTVHDWILATDDLLSSTIERGDLLSRTLYNMYVDGGNLNEGDPLNLDMLKQRFGQLPKRWEVNVFNEKIKMERQDAPPGNSDMKSLLDSVVLYILGGVGIPETWFMGGQNSNRSSGETMEFPTLKKLENRQNTITNIYETLFTYQVIMAEIEPSFKMTTTPLKDTTQKTLSESLKILAESLTNAQIQHWLMPEEAATIYRKLIQDLGTKLKDIPDELKKLLELSGKNDPTVQPPDISQETERGNLPDISDTPDLHLVGKAG